MTTHSSPTQWSAFGESVRGYNHVLQGLPNQDSIAVFQPHPQQLPVIIAVADGHSARECYRSDRGSRFAVEVATEVCHEQFSRVNTQEVPNYNNIATTICEEIISRWRNRVYDDIFYQTGWDYKKYQIPLPENDLAVTGDYPTLLTYGTTLFIVCVSGDCVIYLQIGDGNIITISRSGQMINPLQDEHDDNTPSITNTRSLCYCENGGMFKKQIEIATSDTLPVFIWVATDGYYNSFPDTMKPEEIFLRVIPPIFAYIVERGLDALQEILPSILSDISAQGVSGDDISLGIICNIPAMMTTSLKVYELTPQSRDTGSETGCK